jgi:hypothetical protein
MLLTKDFKKLSAWCKGLVFSLALTGSGLVKATDGPVYYRYKDEAGKTVLSNILPAESSQRGYEIVDRNGRVIKVVAPPLTEEQIAERDRRQAEEALVAEQARVQLEADQALLKQFPRKEDAIRARDRRIAELDTLIIFKQSTILRSESKLAEQEALAANLEKTGRVVPSALKETVSREKSQIDKLKNDIALHESDKADIMKEFKLKIERLDFLSPAK